MYNCEQFHLGKYVDETDKVVCAVRYEGNM